jgi:hypothetical protein
MVGIVQVASRLFGLYPLGAQHQYACDDLQAVGNPVLDFL